MSRRWVQSDELLRKYRFRGGSSCFHVTTIYPYPPS
jgi:hypothetical protein